MLSLISHHRGNMNDVDTWFNIILISVLKVKSRVKGIWTSGLSSGQAAHLASSLSDAPALQSFSAEHINGSNKVLFSLRSTLKHFSTCNSCFIPRFTPFGQQNLVSFSNLSGSSVPAQHFFSVIKNCPVVEAIKMITDGVGRFDSDEMLLLPRLRRIVLIVAKTAMLGNIFPRISTPNLQVLRLGIKDNDFSLTHEFFIRQFIEGSCPPLLHLQFTFPSISDGLLLFILPLLPNLRSLIVKTKTLPVSDAVIRALTCRTGTCDRVRSVLCPKLSEVAISGSSPGKKFNSAALAEMILSRNGGDDNVTDLQTDSDNDVERLRSAEFIYTANSEELLKDSRILSCIGAGLHLVMDPHNVVRSE